MLDFTKLASKTKVPQINEELLSDCSSVASMNSARSGKGYNSKNEDDHMFEMLKLKA